MGIREAYAQLWSVVRLPAVRKLALVLLAFRLGMLPAELAAPLKLLEKGVSKEALAGLVRRPADFLHPFSVCFCALKICIQNCLGVPARNQGFQGLLRRHETLCPHLHMPPHSHSQDPKKRCKRSLAVTATFLHEQASPAQRAPGSLACKDHGV